MRIFNCHKESDNRPSDFSDRKQMHKDAYRGAGMRKKGDELELE